MLRVWHCVEMLTRVLCFTNLRKKFYLSIIFALWFEVGYPYKQKNLRNDTYRSIRSVLFVEAVPSVGACVALSASAAVLLVV